MVGKAELARVIDVALGDAVTEYDFGLTYDDGTALADFIAERVLMATATGDWNPTPGTIGELGDA